MTERDEERDERIEMEIIVDAYTTDEQAMGWHIYLEETMTFPSKHAVSKRKRCHRWRKGRRFVWSANRQRSRLSASSS